MAGEWRGEPTLRAKSAVIVGIQQQGAVGVGRGVDGFQPEHDISQSLIHAAYRLMKVGQVHTTRDTLLIYLCTNTCRRFDLGLNVGL